MGGRLFVAAITPPSRQGCNSIATPQTFVYLNQKKKKKKRRRAVRGRVKRESK